MKLTTNTELLVAALTRLKTVIHTRTTLPILGNVRIEANGALRIAANNLDQCLEMTLDADISTKGEFTLPCHSLLAAISCMDGESVSLTKEKDAVLITGGGRTAKMQGLPSDEFPPVSKREGDAITIPGKDLARWLACCIPAVSVDASRYVLNGVHFTARNGKLCMEATDGHRLVIVESDVSSKLSPSIMPTMGARVLTGLIGDGDVSLSENENNLFASGEGWEFATRKIECNFPNTAQVIPSKQDRNKKVVAVRKSLMDAITYASLFTDTFASIRIESAPGCLTVSAQSDTKNGATQIDGFPKNATITFGMNPSYMLGLLRCFETEEVTLELIDPQSPVTIQQGGITAVVLPIRIS